MSKKSIIGGIILAVIIGVVFVGAQINPDNPDNIQFGNSDIFHVTLADPALYENGVYVEVFDIEEGTYEFGFVPNGDSPKKLSIKLMGKTISFYEDFELQGTLVQDEMSSWYTWEYLGEKNISSGESQKVKIIIDPNGSLKGPVSIQLIPMK